MMFWCTGFGHDEYDDNPYSNDAAIVAYNIARAMQVGNRHIKVEPTDKGICIKFDESLPSWNLEFGRVI